MSVSLLIKAETDVWNYFFEYLHLMVLLGCRTLQVRDLEHQLYEAKLAQYDTADGGGSASESDNEGEEGEEEEVASSSVMQEMSAEERAKFENLQTANARIDELEAEVFGMQNSAVLCEDLLCELFL